MPGGKPAGVRCQHLSDDFACQLFGDPRRPQVCADFRAEPSICGENRDQALSLIALLELKT